MSPRQLAGGAEPAVPRPARDELDDMLLRIGRGDRSVFPRFYDHVMPAVYGVTLRLLRDSGHAEEASQETLVKVWRTARRFDPARGSAMAYTLTVAHGTAVDRVRSEQAGAHRLDRYVAGTSPPYDGVVEHVMDDADRDHVRQCLRSLTDVQRESITLAYYSGHTYADVARLLGTPLSTIKTRMRDGLIRLRDCLNVGGFHAS